MAALVTKQLLWLSHSLLDFSVAGDYSRQPLDETGAPEQDVGRFYDTMAMRADMNSVWR